MRASVIIPVKDRPEMLLEAVRSVDRQTWIGEIEIVVVDDGSAVPVEERVVQAQADGRRVQVVRHASPLGASAARNTGLGTVTGDVIGFLDSDDRWLPTKLEKQITKMISANADVVACGWRWMSFDTGVIRVERVPGADGQYAGFPRWVHNIIPDLLVRRESVAGQVSFPESTLSYEPLEYVLRLFRAGARFVYISEVLCEFRDHHGPRNSSKASYRARRLDALLEEYVDVMSPDKHAHLHLSRMAGIAQFRAGDFPAARDRLWKVFRASLSPAVLAYWALASARAMAYKGLS